MFVCLENLQVLLEILARSISLLISSHAYRDHIVLSTNKKPVFFFSLSPPPQNNDGMNIADLLNKLRRLSLMRIKLGT